jgi:hypothetical protein
MGFLPWSSLRGASVTPSYRASIRYIVARQMVRNLNRTGHGELIPDWRWVQTGRSTRTYHGLAVRRGRLGRCLRGWKARGTVPPEYRRMPADGPHAVLAGRVGSSHFARRPGTPSIFEDKRENTTKNDIKLQIGDYRDWQQAVRHHRLHAPLGLMWRNGNT